MKREGGRGRERKDEERERGWMEGWLEQREGIVIMNGLIFLMLLTKYTSRSNNNNNNNNILIIITMMVMTMIMMIIITSTHK